MNLGENLNLGFTDNLNCNEGGDYGMHRSSIYHFECRDAVGNLKWEETRNNIVMTEGLNDSLDKHFKGSSYTATWFVGLTGASPTFVAGDTAASRGFTENTSYSEATRQTLTLGSVSAGSVSNTASKAVFTASGSTTWGGAFVISNSTKGGTTGVLYGAAALSTNRSVTTGDTLTITVTLTAS